jgi:hypothetical protein
MYRFINSANGDYKINFWEINPQIAIIHPFRQLYERDTTKDKSVSSLEMWCIYMYCDPSYDNKIFRLPPDKKLDAITYVYPDFDKEDTSIAQCITEYDVHCLTSAARAFKEEELSLLKRAEFIKEAPYTFDEIATNRSGEYMYTKQGSPIVIKGTAKDLDAMRKNTLTIYKQYEEVKKMFEEEQGELRVHGGRRESIFEKGELIEVDDKD